ncbi:MAG: ABC transporter substrate-binding protein [Treponema sp.]|jgi:peptide/nickel transport system substrate-binding protein|nr:ABC transporter substrate-binding protein [Treponema sp.]
MEKMSKVTFGFIAALILLFFGCSKNPENSQEQSLLTIDIATAPASLDPAAIASLEDLGLLSSFYPTLTKHGIKQGLPSDAGQVNAAEIVPYLAESWDVSPDGKQYTFHLRKNVQFPGGSPIDSAAVKWSWERAFAAGITGAYFISGGSTVTSIETPDQYTVVVNLSSRAPDYLSALTSVGTAVIDRTVVEKNGATPEEQNRWLAGNFAGGGAYVLESYEPGTSLTLRANPNFWGEAPRHSLVAINFIPDDATLLLRAKNGQADITLGLSNQSVASLKNDSNLKIVSIPAATWELVSLPNAFPPFDNPRFREALTYATPQEQLVENIALGYGQAYYGPFPPAFAAYNEALSSPRPYDIGRAKQLLAESGVTGPVAADIYIREGVNDQRQIAISLQDTWKELGVELTIKQLSAAEYQQAVGAPEKKWLLVRFDGPSIPTPGWLSAYDIISDSPFNQSNYKNPEVERLVREAADEPSDEKRRLIWDEITKLWVADSPRVVAYAQNYTAVLKKDIQYFVHGQNDLLIHLWGR